MDGGVDEHEPALRAVVRAERGVVGGVHVDGRVGHRVAVGVRRSRRTRPVVAGEPDAMRRTAGHAAREPEQQDETGQGTRRLRSRPAGPPRRLAGSRRVVEDGSVRVADHQVGGHRPAVDADTAAPARPDGDRLDGRAEVHPHPECGAPVEQRVGDAAQAAAHVPRRRTPARRTASPTARPVPVAGRIPNRWRSGRTRCAGGGPQRRHGRARRASTTARPRAGRAAGWTSGPAVGALAGWRSTASPTTSHSRSERACRARHSAPAPGPSARVERSRDGGRIGGHLQVGAV